MMFSMVQDLRHSWRALRGAPLFVVAVVLPLALGIGANTAIFSVADSLLRQPLPFTAMERLVLMTEISSGQAYGATPANYIDWQTQSKSFESIAALGTAEAALSSSGPPEAIVLASVTGNFFATLGVTALQGNVFSDEQITGERENSIVVSYNCWEQKLGSDPNIIGKELTVDSAKYTVVGVLKRGSGFPLNADMWRPLVLDAHESNDRSTHRLQIVARVKNGIPVSRAQAEMAAIAVQLGKAYPDTNQGWGVRVFPLTDFVTGGLTAKYTLMLMGAVLFVLLIVCANIANLQFVRGIVRKRDWSLRYALGATRWGVIRLLFLESIILAMLSAGLAVWIANVSLRVIRLNMPASIARFVPGFEQIALNTRAVLFTVAIAVFCAIVSGLVPALFSSRTDINQELKEGSKGATTHRSHQHLSTILLLSEIAVTLVLLVGTGLMVRGSYSLRQGFAGMQPSDVLTARIHLTGPQYARSVNSQRFYQRAIEELARIPGVSSVAVATNIPYAGYSRSASITVQGAPPLKAGEHNSAMVQLVTANFFQTLGIPVRSGRTFSDADNENAPPVAIVSKQLARRYWPNQDAVGRELQLGAASANNPLLRVVGVADDVRYNWLDPDAPIVVYRPAPQSQQRAAFLLLRSQGDPMRLAHVLRQRISAIDQDQPLSEVQSWEEVVSQSMIGLSYVRVMMLVLAGLAVVVAAGGIYGLMSYMVAAKREEIGIRMALGAQRRQIMNMIIGKGMLITILGLGMGLLGSFFLTRMLASLVFGISALDPWTFFGAAGIFVAVALLASYSPAHQASKVDPLSVFRSQ